MEIHDDSYANPLQRQQLQQKYFQLGLYFCNFKIEKKN